MSQENPLPSSSTSIQQSRSQGSLNRHQQSQVLPPIGEEIRLRAHRNSSSQNLRHQYVNDGRIPPAFTYTPYNLPVHPALQLPPAQIQRPPMNTNHVQYGGNNRPFLNYQTALHFHINLMRSMSLMYSNPSAQELENAPNHPPPPYMQFNSPNGIVRNMELPSNSTASYSAYFQNTFNVSYNHQSISLSTTTFSTQNQVHNSHPTLPHASQVINQPTFQSPQNNIGSNCTVSSPQFHQNIMQHPLLAHNLSLDGQMASLSLNQSSSRNIPKNPPQATPPKGNLKSPAKKKNSKKIDKKSKQKDLEEENKSFEPYITAEACSSGIENNTIVQGVVRINPNQFQHAYVSSEDRAEQDIHIEGIKNRNRALEGDVVAVELLPEQVSDNDASEAKQKRGKVVRIIEKVHTRKCTGNLKLMPDRNRQRALFIPRDHRIPRLNIPFTNWPNNFYENAKDYENTIFVANIVDWYDVRYAIGHLNCILGEAGDMLTETVAILAQNDLDISPYGQEVRHLIPRLDFVIPDDEINLREDCRKLCLFSIDPFSCRDIDDALSCKRLENGNYEIGVHISDVAYYLKDDTILDEKVANKATTVYMVERAFHMLPDELCMLCSLFPGVDKLAFSVFWEITEDAQVLGHRFSKTIIRSCAQLAYEHAQAVLDEKEDAKSNFPEIYDGFKYEEIHNTIKILGKISRIFRKQRFDGGALRIDQPKVSFNLNKENGMPESYWIYESKESHQLIEEFMLLANITVANRIYEDHPNIAFLRSHPKPSMFMLRQLEKALKPIGIDLDITSAGSIHRSLLPYTGPNCPDPGKAMVLNMLCAKPMTRAKYFCAFGCEDDDFQHYALNVPMYTHFTSPIRRYADIMVHRLLAASLKYREVPNWDVSKVKKIAAQCNKQKYNAKRAGEMSTELYILKYIAMRAPLVADAVVVEIKDKYIDLIIVKMGLNRRLYFNSDFPGSFNCVKTDNNSKLSKMEVTWSAKDGMPEVKQVIEVFGIVAVEMHNGEDMIKVETKLARPMLVNSVIHDLTRA